MEIPSEEAAPSRELAVDYFRTQLTADLAVVSWSPLFLLALILVFGGSALAGAALALLLVPVAVVLRKRRQLGRRPVPGQMLAELARARHARQSSLFQRHRALVAWLEDHVTTPLLLLAFLAAAGHSLASRDPLGTALAAAGLEAARRLYLGPSRRGAPSPVGDLLAWASQLEVDARLTDASSYPPRIDETERADH